MITEDAPPQESKPISRRERWIKMFVASDAHVPYHDVGVLNLVYDFIRQLVPDIVVLAGDWADCFHISGFPSGRGRVDSFEEEMRIVRANLLFLRKIVPGARIIYIDGNHEHWLRKWIIRNASALEDLTIGGKAITIENVLRLGDLEIEHVTAKEGGRFTDTFWHVEHEGREWDLLIGHFARISRWSGEAVKHLIHDYGMSLIQGHTHSFGRHNRNMERGPVMGWENGCLRDLNPDWASGKHWMHAFAVVWLEVPGNYFQVEDIPIINGQFRYGGELWRTPVG